MITVYVDGSVRPNPGKAGVGVVINNGDVNLVRRSIPIVGERSGNDAEYQALMMGLIELLSMGIVDDEIVIYSDSEMMVNQLNGKRRVIRGDYLHDFYIANVMLSLFPNIKIVWIDRKFNKDADRLSKIARGGK